MPIFSYQCQDCKENFDYSIYRSDDSPHCPSCASENLDKKVSGFSVGKKNEKLRTMAEVDKVCSKITPPKKSNLITGCARGYANKILANKNL